MRGCGCCCFPPARKLVAGNYCPESLQGYAFEILARSRGWEYVWGSRIGIEWTGMGIDCDLRRRHPFTVDREPLHDPVRTVRDLRET